MKFTHEFLHFSFLCEGIFYPFYFAKPPQVVAGHSAEPISQSGHQYTGPGIQATKTIAENTTSELKGTTVAARKEAMNNPR